MMRKKIKLMLLIFLSLVLHSFFFSPFWFLSPLPFASFFLNFFSFLLLRVLSLSCFVSCAPRTPSYTRAISNYNTYVKPPSIKHARIVGNSRETVHTAVHTKHTWVVQITDRLSRALIGCRKPSVIAYILLFFFFFFGTAEYRK